ncbi:MAG: N-acetyltransferase [Deltaproteobacteria bacterium]|nr:N-acetyltransferase [Deltaproteobacteria bacterium]
MKLEIPEKVSQEQITFDVRELEPLLQAPAMNVPPYEPCYVELKDGRKMVIRPARHDEAPKLLEVARKLLDVDHDFYDIVGARVYAEVLGWYRKRLKDPYQMVGLVDGELVGFCNGRLVNDEINMSLHTLAFARGGRVGATMYYAKCEYAFEILGQEEFWATYESYNGFKRWGIGMAQPSYPWPETQHELGGARVYYITREYWTNVVKDYIKQMIGTDLVRPVPEELLAKNHEMTIPENPAI